MDNPFKGLSSSSAWNRKRGNRKYNKGFNSHWQPSQTAGLGEREGERVTSRMMSPKVFFVI